MIDAILIGAAATGFLDLWSTARARFFGAAAPDYALVGRWLAHLARGRLVHDAIARSAPVKGEWLIGWVAHYLIGIAFAAVLLIGWGTAWAREPTLIPALIVGIGSVAAPFLLMQPGMAWASPRAARPIPPLPAAAASSRTRFSVLASTRPAGRCGSSNSDDHT